MTGGLPRGWSRETVGDVCEKPQYGLSHASRPDGNAAIVGMKDMADGQVRINDLARVEVTPREQEVYRLRPGDLLLNRTNSPDLVGKLSVWTHRPEIEAVFASYLVRFSVKQSRVLPAYLIAALRTNRAEQQIGRLVTRGVSQANINPTAFADEVTVLVPPLPEQRRIVAVLDAWDQAITMADRIAACMKLRNVSLITRLAWDETHPLAPLEDFLSRSTVRVGIGREPPVFSVSKDGLAPQAERFNKRIANEDLSRHMLVAPGDLALSGLNFWMGSVDVNTTSNEICISPDYKVYRLAPVASPRFFRFLVRTEEFRRLLERCSTERASIVRRNFNGELFMASPVPVPEKKVQEERVIILEALADEIDATLQIAALLRSQKRALMQKLLTGEWRLGEDFDDYLPPVQSAAA